MEWIQGKNPVRDGLDIYLCYMDMGKSRVLRHNKPCFGGRYMLLSYIPDITLPVGGGYMDYHKIHRIAEYIKIPEIELQNIMVEKFHAVLITVDNIVHSERLLAEEIHFDTVEDITAASEWLLSLSLINNMTN